MNKYVNTALFIIGGTVVILILAGIIYFLPIVVMAMFFKNQIATVAPYIMNIWPLVAIIGSFIIYNALLKLLQSKVDMKKYFLEILWKKKP